MKQTSIPGRTRVIRVVPYDQSFDKTTGRVRDSLREVCDI